MVRPETLENALFALSVVMFQSRAMASNGRSPDELADVLEFVEYLPPLLASPDDSTEAFRAFLEGLVARHPEFGFALERFDALETPREWWS